MKFDLHVHTNYSDGIFPPEKVIELAKNRGLSGIAITDHDTIEGVKYIFENKLIEDNFKIIPGIELSSIVDDEEVHILGYFIDIYNRDLIDLAIKLKESRVTRGHKMIEKLNSLGINISEDDVRKFAGKGFIGRPHIGRALIAKGCVESIDEAFEIYLDRGKPAYAGRYKLNLDETIGLIKNAGGLSVLAHPILISDRNIIDLSISQGIDGIECIHSKHNDQDTKEFTQIGIRNNLIITGGSDFHGDKMELLGKYYIDIESIKEFKDRI